MPRRELLVAMPPWAASLAIIISISAVCVGGHTDDMEGNEGATGAGGNRAARRPAVAETPVPELPAASYLAAHVAPRRAASVDRITVLRLRADDDAKVTADDDVSPVELRPPEPGQRKRLTPQLSDVSVGVDLPLTTPTLRTGTPAPMQDDNAYSDADRSGPVPLTITPTLPVRRPLPRSVAAGAGGADDGDAGAATAGSRPGRTSSSSSLPSWMASLVPTRSQVAPVLATGSLAGAAWHVVQQQERRQRQARLGGDGVFVRHHRPIALIGATVAAVATGIAVGVRIGSPAIRRDAIPVAPAFPTVKPTKPYMVTHVAISVIVGVTVGSIGLIVALLIGRHARRHGGKPATIHCHYGLQSSTHAMLPILIHQADPTTTISSPF